MANADAKGAPKPPPNLRIAGDEAKECDSCKHFVRGKCSEYSNLPVDDEWVCDSWAKGSPDDDEPDDTPVEKQPKTLRAATAEMRRRVARDRAA